MVEQLDTFYDFDESEERIASIVDDLSLEEKIALMSGEDFWTLPALQRHSIPSLRFSDGPTGLRSVNSDPATVFPVGTALAATWNPDLVQEIGAAIGREAIAYGVDVVLAPGVNLQRTPLGGRNFEYYSEDPVLTAEIGTAFVAGTQSEGVGTSLKHFALNNQEHNRMTSSSNVGERVIRELYFHAFEHIVREAKPWTIMSAYNRINGVFASEHDWMLSGVLRGEWGFEGAVISDWGAAKSTVASANAGLDIEMPGPGRFYGEALVAAVKEGNVDLDTINAHVARILRLIIRCGLLDGNPKTKRGELSSDRHRTLSRRAATECIVLLKNDDNVLPINRGQSIAVIGAIADHPTIQGGGSSQVTPERIVTPLEGLQAEFAGKSHLTFARGFDHEKEPPTMDGRLLSVTPEGGEKGLLARYFDNPSMAGTSVYENVEWQFSKLGFGAQAQTQGNAGFSVEWTGYIKPRYSGTHQFTAKHSNPEIELRIGDEVLIDKNTMRETELLFMILPLNRRKAEIELEAGKVYPISIKYEQPEEGSIKAFNIFNVGLREPSPVLEEAISAAKASDCALIFVGGGTTSETEGMDRETLRLSDAQNKMVVEVARTCSRTVVIVNSGGPVEMPWVDDVSAVLQMWLPGQECGLAIADVISGAHSPSGKLPTTFPRRYEDNPTSLHYPGGSQVDYGEGLLIGYRHYDAAGLEPLFPFGHGLSYSQFELSDLKCPSTVLAGNDAIVEVTLRNTGDAVGSETVQLYLENTATPETTVPRSLTAFTKIELKPNKDKLVKLHIKERSFAWYDVDELKWAVTPGFITCW